MNSISLTVDRKAIPVIFNLGLEFITLRKLTFKLCGEAGHFLVPTISVGIDTSL